MLTPNSAVTPNSAGIHIFYFILIHVSRFSYHVGTPQSQCTRENESNLTYLNKGQAYELTLECTSPSVYAGYLIEVSSILVYYIRTLVGWEC